MSAQGKRRSDYTSPFLAISPAWRIAIISYFVLYEIVFPAVAGVFNQDAQLYLFPRIILHSIRVFLIIFPIVVYRREYGFLHPIILPILISTFESVMKYPLTLIAPVSMPAFEYAVSTNSRAASLVVGYADLAALRVWYELLQIFGLICYYAGYFMVKSLPVPSLKVGEPRNLTAVCGAALLVCVGIGLAFIQFSKGGLAAHLIAMRGGRAALFEGQGQYIVIAEFSIVVALAWFLYLKRPFANPFWLFGMAAASFTTLVIAGSRSSLIYALITLLLLWWWKMRKVVLLPAITVGVCSILVLSIFGSIRQDWGSQTINTSVFNVSALAENFERASREFEHRDDEEGGLAALAGSKEGLLWGRSYVAAASFWVPRAMWPDKPHGAGAYNMWINFARGTMDDFGSRTYWGIPLDSVTEAYWNLSLPGVLLFIGLFGAFHRWLTNLVLTYPQSPMVLLFSVWMCTHFAGDPNSFITSIRSGLLLIGLAMLLGVVAGKGSVRRPMSRLANSGSPTN